MGPSMMGTGEAEGEDRAAKAAEAAISNPLLEDYCLSTATGVPARQKCPGAQQPMRPPPSRPPPTCSGALRALSL